MSFHSFPALVSKGSFLIGQKSAVNLPLCMDVSGEQANVSPSQPTAARLPPGKFVLLGVILGTGTTLGVRVRSVNIVA